MLFGAKLKECLSFCIFLRNWTVGPLLHLGSCSWRCVLGLRFPSVRFASFLIRIQSENDKSQSIGCQCQICFLSNSNSIRKRPIRAQRVQINDVLWFCIGFEQKHANTMCFHSLSCLFVQKSFKTIIFSQSLLFFNGVAG